jgi:hypothetical protein
MGGLMRRIVRSSFLRETNLTQTNPTQANHHKVYRNEMMDVQNGAQQSTAQT